MRVLPLVLGSCLTLTVACGTPGTATTANEDGGTTIEDMDAGVPYPAEFPEPPHVITYGGPVLQNPRFVPVFFDNDDPQIISQMTSFESSVGTTDYWKQTTSEFCYWATADHSVDPQFCVGDGHATPTVTVDAAELNGLKSTDGTISDDAIKAWLAAKLDNNDPAFPAPDGNSIYVLHFPRYVEILLAGGYSGTSRSCREFGGYHSDLTVTGRLNNKVAYAVIPRCASFGNLGGIDALTGTTSHELIEAATDPYPNLFPAYATVDTGHQYMALVIGGTENADMCAQEPTAFTEFDEIPFVVQRSWSNVSARAGHDPCVPALPDQVYFAAGPVLSEIVNVNNQYIGRAQFVGVKVPVGQSRVVPLQLYSDGDTGGPWNVSVKDGAELLLGGASDVSLSLDKTSGQNGDVINLTITAKRTMRYGFSVFRVRSSLNGVNHDWWGAVGN